MASFRSVSQFIVGTIRTKRMQLISVLKCLTNEPRFVQVYETLLNRCSVYTLSVMAKALNNSSCPQAWTLLWWSLRPKKSCKMDGGWGGSSIKTGVCVCCAVNWIWAALEPRTECFRWRLGGSNESMRTKEECQWRTGLLFNIITIGTQLPNNVVSFFVCRKREKRAINVEGHSGCGHELLSKCLLARTETRFQMRSSRI